MRRKALYIKIYNYKQNSAILEKGFMLNYTAKKSSGIQLKAEPVLRGFTDAFLSRPEILCPCPGDGRGRCGTKTATIRTSAQKKYWHCICDRISSAIPGT
jgi:hypothetical protein